MWDEASHQLAAGTESLVLTSEHIHLPRQKLRLTLVIRSFCPYLANAAIFIVYGRAYKCLYQLLKNVAGVLPGVAQGCRGLN